MARALDQSEKESYLLVTFTYGDPASPSFAYYTNKDSDEFPFLSMPSLQVKVPPNTGLFDEGLCEVELARDAFSDRLTDGLPTSPCHIQVEEITQPMEGGATVTRLLLFVGKVVCGIRNAGGNSNMRKTKASSPKLFLDVVLGVPANHECELIFNGPGCNPPGLGRSHPVGQINDGGVITAIDGKRLTMPGVLTGSGRHPWQRGHVSKDGVIIEIRDWDSAFPDFVYLTRQPPSYWLSQTIAVTAGCDQSVERCDLWSNRDNFDGAGYGIPAYHPVFEDSP